MSSAKKQQANEVLIEGRLYDIVNLKHPGGSIIKFHSGSGDATEPFREFHMRSTKARKLLATLPNRPAPQESIQTPQGKRAAALSHEFSILRRELLAEGWFDPSPIHCAYRVVEILLMHLAGLYLVLYTSWWLVGLAMLGLVQGRCGWLMHEAGHFSFSGWIQLDHKVQEFLFGWGSGMSAAWWRIQHNKHHCAPQKLHHDVDLDTLPLVAFHAAIAVLGKKNIIVRNWLKIQQFMFVPITCSLVTAAWQFLLHPRHMYRTKRYFEMFCVLLRFMEIYFVGRAVGVTLGQSVVGLLIANFVGGGYIFVNFALSHTHMPVVKADEHAHWLEYSANHTINIHEHPITSWWMAYLNYQIEHHLFPSMPQFRFVALSPRVRKLFESNGLKYDCRGYFEALGHTFTNLGRVGASLN